jgi:acetyl-CoA synthetase
VYIRYRAGPSSIGIALIGIANAKTCNISPSLVASIGAISAEFEMSANRYEPPCTIARQFIEARDLLLRSRTDWQTARRAFRWPRLEYFNWAKHYFDYIARDNDRCALRIVTDEGIDDSLTFRQLSSRSVQMTRFMQRHGLAPQDRVLVMLRNVSSLWQVMLALIRMGGVIVPTTTLLQPDELADRLTRGGIRGIITESQFTDRFDFLTAAPIRFSIGSGKGGWIDLAAAEAESVEPGETAETRADDLLFLYLKVKIMGIVRPRVITAPAILQ